jgi:hypothetical protein
MPEIVRVGAVESNEKILAAIEDYFKRGRYAEITQAIGMHAILIDPEHSIEDQNRLYRKILSMLKDRIAAALGRQYAAWYADFPHILDRIISGQNMVTDKGSAEVLASHRASHGAFRSADDFFFWALDDRRLTLEQIVKYFDKCVEAHGK